jgi:hypothetical protein
MIIVRRVIHKKTTSFGLFTPEQLGQTFQCNFAKRDDISFRRDKKYRHIRDIRRGAKRRDEISSQRQQIKQGIEEAEKVAQNTKQSYRGISDPWDEPFSRKVDSKGNPKMPSFPRLLGSGTEPGITGDTPPPQSPNTATNSKTVTKSGSNSKAVLAGLAAAGLVGAGAYFIRRRRSSKGKQIIERVRRK